MIVFGSDGLFDNVWDRDIAAVVTDSVSVSLRCLFRASGSRQALVVCLTSQPASSRETRTVAVCCRWFFAGGPDANLPCCAGTSPCARGLVIRISPATGRDEAGRRAGQDGRRAAGTSSARSCEGSGVGDALDDGGRQGARPVFQCCVSGLCAKCAAQLCSLRRCVVHGGGAPRLDVTANARGLSRCSYDLLLSGARVDISLYGAMHDAGRGAPFPAQDAAARRQDGRRHRRGRLHAAGRARVRDVCTAGGQAHGHSWSQVALISGYKICSL